MIEQGYWAIREVGTNKYLPAGRKTGFTHDEPVDASKKPPRLFTSSQAAIYALAWWMKGKVTLHSRYTSNFFGNEDDGEDWKTEEVPERKLKKMQIVRVHLVVNGKEAA
jgi:hypothetical protein